MSKFQDLIVWQKSMDLVDAIYELAKSFPKEEQFGLWSQLTRAAVSVPSNIAEGSGRATRKELVRFLSIARGSRYETHTQLLIAERRGYATITPEVLKLIDEIARMLTAMLHKGS